MRLAIFGATGGSVLSCLTQAIKAPDVTTITVLARTPTKLTDLLEKRNLSIPAKLKIVQGDAKSLEAVKECIQSTDVVITGIGISHHYHHHHHQPPSLSSSVQIAGHG